MSSELAVYSEVNKSSLIDYIQHHWHLWQKTPSVEQISQFLEVPNEAVVKMLADGEIKERLKRRGIELTQASVLSSEQIATANLLLDFTDSRPQAQKLRALGVLPATYQGWLSNPEFNKYMRQRAEYLIDNVGVTTATEALFNQTQKGNMQAIKLLLELTGRHRDSTSINVEFLLSRVVEIVATHVPDPEILRAIGEDFEQLMKEGLG